MMKLQDVLLKAMANKISWASAAEIISVARTMRRWRALMERDGYSGLVDGRKGKRQLPARAAGSVRTGVAVVSGDALRLQRAAVSRKAEPGAWDRTEPGQLR
jgi:hypothetical protein